jgi:5-methylcytosine-specific restriction endonuclease McrA
MIRKIVGRYRITKRERLLRSFKPAEQEEIRNSLGDPNLDPLAQVKIETLEIIHGGSTTFSNVWQLEGEGKWQTALIQSSAEAVPLAGFWMVKHELYRAEVGLNAKEVWALIAQKEQAKQRKLKRAMAALEVDESARRREPIPDDVKIFVWQRDQGKCVKCGSNKELEFDHIIPLAMGGSNTARNIQLLCAICNGIKGPNLT